jgi:methylglutaconyl-CoA hydratase
MSNPIADPLVENPISPDLEGLVTLDASVAGAVTVSLANPGNALDGEVAGALREAFETLHAADHVRVVFLRDVTGTFFSGPLADWARIASTEWSAADLRDEAMIVAHMLHALTRIPALTVALVEGEATGVGAGLVAACDMAVAASGASFAFPEVKGGAVPAMAAPYVVNAIGPRQAKNLFMTGRAFDAAYALQTGLVQEVVDASAMDAAIARLTAEALSNSPEAMHEAKAMVWQVWGRPLDHALLEETAKRFVAGRFGEEGREGLAAVVEGRRPGWAIP